MTELKPCPFCGGEAVLVDNDVIWHKTAIICNKCFAGTDTYPHCIYGSADKAKVKAQEAWNRRVGT